MKIEVAKCPMCNKDCHPDELKTQDRCKNCIDATEKTPSKKTSVFRFGDELK